MKRFVYIFIALAGLLVAACKEKSTPVAKSSVAQLTAFAFARNDSMPGLAKAVFVVEERLDTGLVWNRDSMLYGTRLDSVVPKFTFAATPGEAKLTTPTDTIPLTGYDTVDFSRGPIFLTVTSQDKSKTKIYEIRPTVHRVDPDLYQWSQLYAGFAAQEDCEQRVVEQGSDFVLFANNGFAISTYRSADGVAWSEPDVVTGLPAGTKVRQIISDGTTLYYGQGNAIYTSTDAKTWTANTVSPNVVTMLLFWNERVWALVGTNDDYELAYVEGTTLTLSGLKPVNSSFPVSDFATVTFLSSSGRNRAMIIGGFSENGISLNTRWNLEYSGHIEENDGYRMQEFSIDRPSFTSLTGISVVSYNNQLLMFGGVDADMTYFGRDILISNDEGLNWDKADPEKNQLPEVYQARQKQTAIVRNNYIYLFGGQDKSATYSDVYRGRLNSIDW
ncbi:MAG: DUF6242 domain-containing protein [Paludibacteraceae bacterium]|nr:DUF6242 domain-containing protein [Paludibacteraceae bacterium]